MHKVIAGTGKKGKGLCTTVLLAALAVFFAAGNAMAAFSADTNGDGKLETIESQSSCIRVTYQNGSFNCYGMYTGVIHDIYAITDTDGQPGAEIIVTWQGTNGRGIDVIHDRTPQTAIRTYPYQSSVINIWGIADTDDQPGPEIILTVDGTISDYISVIHDAESRTSQPYTFTNLIYAITDVVDVDGVPGKDIVVTYQYGSQFYIRILHDNTNPGTFFDYSVPGGYAINNIANYDSSPESEICYSYPYSSTTRYGLITDRIRANDQGGTSCAGLARLAPSAPSGLTATAESSSKISLAWTDNSTNETQFKVERKTGAGGAYQQIATVGANVTTYGNTGLTQNTTYYYRVRAYNANGNSAYSNEANATTPAAPPPPPPPPPPPAAPSNLLPLVISETQISLLWNDNSTNETQFAVERKVGLTGYYQQLATVNANVITYTDNGLTPDTLYGYRVRAYNSNGYSSYSNESMTTIQVRTLSVQKKGSGEGTVTSSYPGINCGSDCTEDYWTGRTLSLIPYAAQGSTFVRWTGACSGSGTCTVTMSSTQSVQAWFASPDMVGIYRSGHWLLDIDYDRIWEDGTDILHNFGVPGDTHVAGDWNGDGATEIGVFRDGYWYLDSNGSGAWESSIDTLFLFGAAGDLPVSGDWNGAGISAVGVFRNGTWLLDLNGNGIWEPGSDGTHVFGAAGDVPVTGDWNKDGITDIGVFRDGTWYLDLNGNRVWEPGVDASFTWGIAGDIPIVGDWNGDGISDGGVFRNNGFWFIDTNGNRQWESGVDETFKYGTTTDRPVSGSW